MERWQALSRGLLEHADRISRVVALDAALVLGAVGCGGKATDLSDPDLSDPNLSDPGLGGARLLAACEPQRCMDGFECGAGVCTRSCSADDECSDGSAAARCREVPSDPGRRVCTVSCSSDYGCRHLGAGSYCDGTSCVAHDLPTLPDPFERLELRRISEAVRAQPFAVCREDELTARVEVNLRTRRLSWSTCDRGDDADGEGFDIDRVELDDSDVSQVLRAYREVRPSTMARCVPGARPFTLDLESTRNFALLFADAEHSACPNFDLLRGSFLEGLEGFYAALEALTGVRQ